MKPRMVVFLPEKLICRSNEYIAGAFPFFFFFFFFFFFVRCKSRDVVCGEEERRCSSV